MTRAVWTRCEPNMDRIQKIAAVTSALAFAGMVALGTYSFASLDQVIHTEVADVDARVDSPPISSETPLQLKPVTSESVEDSTSSDGHPLQTINGQTFSAVGPGNCESNAAIYPYGPHDPAATLHGELTDMGATELAGGPVGYTHDGLISTYTVQPGDSMLAIGERFCIDYVTVQSFNGAWPPAPTIQPGDVLVLRP